MIRQYDMPDITALRKAQYRIRMGSEAAPSYLSGFLPSQE